MADGALPLDWPYLPDVIVGPTAGATTDQRLMTLAKAIQDNQDATARAIGSSVASVTQAPTFQNSWGNLGGGYQAAGVWKAADGTCFMQGVITKSATAAAEALLNVPAEFRPAAGHIFIVAYASATPTYGFARLELATGGDLSLVAGSLGAVTIGHISLGGISWRVV